MKNFELDIIKEYIYNKEIVFEDDFKDYFFQSFPNRSENYYHYYLLELYRKNLLYKYNINKLKPCRHREKFLIDLDIERSLMLKLNRINPSVDISIWNTSILDNFMSLQQYTTIYIVETYAYAKEIILNVLLDSGKNAVYEEDYFIMSKYNNRRSTIYVVRTINEDSPIVKSHYRCSSRRGNLVTIPKIEKILVDLFVDDFYCDLFSSEIYNIYRDILKYYQINIGTVLRYAKKRYCYGRLIDYFNSIGFDVERGEFMWF